VGSALGIEGRKKRKYKEKEKKELEFFFLDQKFERKL